MPKLPSASTQSIASQNVMGRWTHTFTRCPVSVAACHSEAERSPTNARCKQTHRNTNPKRAGRNLLQSHQRRSMNSYGYYFLNAACHRSSSSSSHPLPPPALPPSTLPDASAIRVNPHSQSCRQQLLSNTSSFRNVRSLSLFRIPSESSDASKSSKQNTFSLYLTSSKWKKEPGNK